MYIIAEANAEASHNTIAPNYRTGKELYLTKIKFV